MSVFSPKQKIERESEARVQLGVAIAYLISALGTTRHYQAIAEVTQALRHARTAQAMLTTWEEER